MPSANGCISCRPFPPDQQRPAAVDTEPPVTLPELTTAEQTLIDYAILGFCLDRQVMELYERQRRVLRVTRADRLGQRRSGACWDRRPSRSPAPTISAERVPLASLPAARLMLMGVLCAA